MSHKKTQRSTKNVLPMSLDDYLKLLDWTGRQFRTDKRGVIPATCAPILDRLDCSEETWFDLVRNFRKRFRNEAGSYQFCQFCLYQFCFLRAESHRTFAGSGTTHQPAYIQLHQVPTVFS